MSREERIGILEQMQLDSITTLENKEHYQALEETIQDLKKLDEIEKNCIIQPKIS